MNKPNFKQNEISKIQRASDKKKRKCVISGCNNNAINSHLLQRNGILNNISENGHVIERRVKDPNQFVMGVTPSEYKRVGLKNALSKPLLCNYHDTEIFKPIESDNVDFDSYYSHLLLSYRATLAELRTKEITIEKLQNTLDSKILHEKFDRFPIETLIDGMKLGINDIMKFIKIFEQELQSENENFVFQSFSYPLIKVYGSAAFTPDKTFDWNSTNPDIPYEQIFIHIIPLKQELKIIAGYHKDFQNRYVRKFIYNLSAIKRKNKLGIELTKLFCDRIENWGMSPEVYRRIEKKKLERFEKQAKKTLYFPDMFTSNLNIFSNENST